MSSHSDTSPDFRVLFEATPGLYLILSPDLKIVAVNDAYCLATKIIREDILGRFIFDVFPDNPDDPNASGVSNLRASLQRVVQLRRPDAMAVQKYDIRRPASEGGGFEERYWSPLNVPVLDAGQELRWIVHRVEDVTQLIRAKAEHEARDRLAHEQQRIIDQLRSTNEELARQLEENARLEKERQLAIAAVTASESRFRTLANNLPGVVYRRIMTREGKFSDVYISDGLKAILGIDPAEMASSGRTLLEFIHPEDRERKIAALKNSAMQMKPFVIEVRKLTQPDQKIRWWQIHTTPTRLDNGDVQWDGIALDITDRKAAEHQLEQALKMEAIGQLTGGIAHDFNNLLTVILSNADALAEELKDNPDLRALAEMTRAAAERGAELTNGLLAFARRQALEPQALHVNKLVAGMDGILRRTLGDDIEIELVQGAGLWKAMVDPVQLESALLNLALNARDAMPGGGRLTIETGNASIDAAYSEQYSDVVPGQYVLVCVSDTGTGMTPEIAARAFDPFFSTKEVGKGTGLGLAMVYGFVKQSGGHIKIYSEIGQGTSFKIYLPRCHQNENAPDARTAKVPADPAGNETILLVEDDDLVREHAHRLLTALGYHVLVAHNGAAALAILERGDHVDLLFTDVVMPGGIGGKQLADKTSVLRPAVKILFTSGYTQNAIVHHGRLDPGVHLIKKPYRKHDLAVKLRQMLGAKD